MLIAPDGAIGHAEIRLGDSVIRVSDAQGKEYKPMQSLCGRLRLDKVFVRTFPLP